GQFAAARTNAALVLQKQPGRHEALAVLVNSARTTNDLAAIAEQIGEMRKKDTDRPGYHIGFGMVYQAEGQGTNAETEFHKALELDPKLATAHVGLANLYWRRGDTNLADQAFQAAIQISPARSPGPLEYAVFKLNTGSVEGAKRIAAEITKKTP